MRELTCIVCPIGCSLAVEGEDPSALTISGNRCARGAVYAREEIFAPKRVLTATCAIAFAHDEINSNRSLTAPRRIPVKTSIPCPKEKTFELLEDIYKVKLSLPIKAGTKPIVNWQGTGIDIVVTRSLE